MDFDLPLDFWGVNLLLLLPGPFWDWYHCLCLLAIPLVLVGICFRRARRSVRASFLVAAVAIAAGHCLAVRYENAADLGSGTPVQKLCYHLQDFDWDDNPNMVYHRTAPGRQRAFVAACAEAFEGLGEEQRGVLGPLLGAPLAEAARTSRPEQPGYVWPREEVEQLRRAVTAEEPRKRLPPGRSADEIIGMMKGVYNETGEPETLAWLETLRKMYAVGAIPNQEPAIRASEIPEALRHGRVARFDASELLPPRTFNISPSELAELHGGEEAAKGIQVAEFGARSTCRFLAYTRKWVLPYAESLCPPYKSVYDMLHSDWGPPVPYRDIEAGRINLRRLPNYIDFDAVIRKLGLEDEVERVEPQMNIQYSRGEAHYDEQDNIFIGVRGLNFILTSDANYTDAAHGHKDSGYTRSWFDWLHTEQDGSDATWRRDHMPFYAVVLRPGEGVTIPSRSYHAVLSSYQRIGINFFLEPKYKRMRWPGAPRSYWWRESSERVALRNLAIQSVGRLWETKKLGFLMQVGLELL